MARKAAIVTVLVGLLGMVAASSTLEAGAQQAVLGWSLSVTTVVAGAPGNGTAVDVSCAPTSPTAPDHVELRFGADGRGTVASGHIEGWAVVPSNGTWIFQAKAFPAARTTCSVTQVDSGGAAAIAWTCAEGQFGGPTDVGCPGPSIRSSGVGAGPIVVLIAAAGDNNITEEAAAVTFTNTFAAPPPPVEVPPSFTG
jgi:hypothetical protein